MGSKLVIFKWYGYSRGWWCRRQQHSRCVVPIILHKARKKMFHLHFSVTCIRMDFH